MDHNVDAASHGSDSGKGFPAAHQNPSAVASAGKEPPKTVGSSMDSRHAGIQPQEGTLESEDDTKGQTQGAIIEHLPAATIPSVRPAARETLENGEGLDGENPDGNTTHPGRGSPMPRRAENLSVEQGWEDGFKQMHKLSVYETVSRFYVVGADMSDSRFRILKIDREVDELSITEDDIVYSKGEMSQLLDAINAGNKSSGGLKVNCNALALLGFIRFTGAYYMLLVTKRSQVALLGGHYIYQVDDTALISLSASSSSTSRGKHSDNAEEARYVAILNNIDLSRSFYFSYCYDVTRTLQHNICWERKFYQSGIPKRPEHDYNTMFVWNHHLLAPAISKLKNPFDWCLPIIHGYVNQAKICVYSKLVYITLIARRSRFFAGARFLKRGANDFGHVANDVETEQIVSEVVTTSFHSAGPRLYANPQYASYVQHRGSIPLYWTQENTGVTPKPDISLNVIDPFYSAAALHFDNLFERYGTPVFVLNLIKVRERTPRESKLLKEFTNAVTYLNQFLPDGKKIEYTSYDMSRASKNRDQDVIGTLEHISGVIIPRTGIFRNGDDAKSGLQLQNGVARTNCIDCLDRTNAAQSVIGKRALGHQLRALGIIGGTTIEYDSDAANLFTNMWHDHGDSIAIQYGGSHLVNTMETYRKINQWSSQSRDMVESFKRYYNNSFLDAQRQEAYNLFLGNYIFSHGQPMLWDLSTDYYLHHSNPRHWSMRKKPNYIRWYTPDNLREREFPPLPQEPKEPLSHFDDYWLEYYRPAAVTSFSKVFSFKMLSSVQYLPAHSGLYEFSPFIPRIQHEQLVNRDRHHHRSVKIQEPADVYSHRAPLYEMPGASSTTSDINSHRHVRAARENEWVQGLPSSTSTRGILHDPSASSGTTTPYDRSRTTLDTKIPLMHSPAESKVLSKARLAQMALGQLVTDSLNPSVTASEAEEYERYVNHPLRVPLVVTSENEITAAAVRKRGQNRDLLDFFNSCNVDDSRMEALAEKNLEDYVEFLSISDEGLTVVADDYANKRYKRYKQWLRGKSLFKQWVDS